MSPDRLRRIADAKERQAQHDVRDPAAQLRLLDDRPGQARRERERLTAQLKPKRRKAVRKAAKP